MRANKQTEIQTNDRILRPRDAAKKLGIGRSKLYQLIALNELHPIRLGPRAVGLRESELDRWIASRPLARGAR